MYDFLEQGTRILRRAGEVGGIDPEVVELMAAPGRVLEFRIPLRMDDGRRRIFDAYRVRYNEALGPCRDGTRISAGLEPDEVKALGLLMSIKHAAGGIPAGGGKGGIVADPSSLTDGEYERLCRAYIRFLRPKGPACDVPGADIGTDSRAMAWMLDEYEQITGCHNAPAINDKPAILGGSLGGREATGRGVFDLFEEAARRAGLEVRGATIAIQGFGQVGSVAATCFAQAGCRIVAVADRQGGVHRREGLDVQRLIAHAQEAGTVKGCPGTQPITNMQLLECDCAVLVPAAVQGVLTADNADRVQARLLVEGANAPSTLEADEILSSRGVTIVPDVITNSGSVHVCQMEQTQGLSNDFWSLETVEMLRRKRMLRSYQQTLETADTYGLRSLRLAAWINGLRRIEEAVHARGWC